MSKESRRLAGVVESIRFNGISLLRLNDTSKPALIEWFVDAKIKQMREHVKGAERLGINDLYCKNFNREDALDSLDEYLTYVFYEESNEFGGSVVGFVQISSFPWFNDKGNSIKVENLYVDEAHRHKGHARSLIDGLKTKFYDIVLEVWYGIDSQKFYEKLNFKEIGRIMVL